ncbi:hypothetical protein TrLO_g1637 [Triparma laevis f. longispina]|uniref:NAD-dependent epimerase/dehydratase domain-containing protein n=1 Tax=Triparma laevis f. longispina TaxID=1714387 RepID=A0A9W7AFM2_9STRA|nr:hypothetical protein TrLO_g1637 [Triparma laevis f. longispina]
MMHTVMALTLLIFTATLGSLYSFTPPGAACAASRRSRTIVFSGSDSLNDPSSSPSRRPRVLVFGGSGFIGSRICNLLSSSGCTVTSISRTGLCPKSCTKEEVNFIAYDVLSNDVLKLKRHDITISCIGNMRPSPSRSGFFGLHWDSSKSELENGLTTSRTLSIAQQIKTKNFAYISSYSLMMYGLAGALEGYVQGKLSSESEIKSKYPNTGTIVSPVIVYGGSRFEMLGKVVAFIDSTFLIRGYNKILRAIKENTASGGLWPQDAISEVFLTSPSSVDDVVLCVCVGVLNDFNVGILGERELMPLTDGSSWVERGEERIDGPDEIKRVAEVWKGGIKSLVDDYVISEYGDDKEAIIRLPEIEEIEQGTSGFNKPFEGAFEGQHQYLSPILPAASVLGFFVGMIKYSIYHSEQIGQVL